MNMRECKNCHEYIKDELEVCPFCGYIDLSSPEQKRSLGVFDKKRIPIWVKILIPSVLILVGITVVFVKMGLFDTRDETEESVFESEQTEAEMSVNGITLLSEVSVDVLNMDGHSFACYFGCESWEQARDYCESVGGHLAVITSPRENEALYAFARCCGYDNIYIGYSDIESEGHWQWVNGEHSDYTNWNEGEPNGFTSSENYAVMVDNGCWNDGDYSPRIENGIVAYVCEWDYEVTGVNNYDYETVIALAPDVPESSEVSMENADEVASQYVLTEELARLAFERFFSDYEARFLSWSYSEVGYDDYFIYKLEAYAGGDSYERTFFYMDLETGLTRDITYLDTTAHLAAADPGIDLMGISVDVFNAWDYLPEYGIEPPSVENYALDSNGAYDALMEFIDNNEQERPGSLYSIGEGYDYYNEDYFWMLYICYPNGTVKAFVLDDYGVLPLVYEFYYDYYVAYDVIRSLPTITGTRDLVTGSEDNTNGNDDAEDQTDSVEDQVVQAFSNYWDSNYSVEYTTLGIVNDPNWGTNWGWFYCGTADNISSFRFVPYTGGYIMYYVDLTTGLTDYVVYNSMDTEDSRHYAAFNIWDYL